MTPSPIWGAPGRRGALLRQQLSVKAFDGVPLDVNVAFPPQPASGPEGNYPLVMTKGAPKLGRAGRFPLR